MMSHNYCCSSLKLKKNGQYCSSVKLGDWSSSGVIQTGTVHVLTALTIRQMFQSRGQSTTHKDDITLGDNIDTFYLLVS